LNAGPVQIIHKDDAPEPLANRLIKWNKRFYARHTLGKALRDVRLTGFTLDLGSSASPYPGLYESGVAFDIVPYEVDVTGDAHFLPFRPCSFQNILCTEVLEHLTNPEQAVREMERVLKPGGTLVLSTRFIFPVHDAPHDYYRFTRHGLEWLFRRWRILSLAPTDRSFESLNIAYNRLVHDKNISKLLRAMIFVHSLINVPLTRLLSRSATSDSMASGYALIAEKES